MQARRPRLSVAPFTCPARGVAFGSHPFQQAVFRWARHREFAMKLQMIFAVALAAALGVVSADAQPAPNTVDAHLAAAKKAAGVDFRGVLGALCVAPANRPPPDVTPAPPPPNRASWYTEPA